MIRAFKWVKGKEENIHKIKKRLGNFFYPKTTGCPLNSKRVSSSGTSLVDYYHLSQQDLRNGQKSPCLRGERSQTLLFPPASLQFHPTNIINGFADLFFRFSHFTPFHVSHVLEHFNWTKKLLYGVVSSARSLPEGVETKYCWIEKLVQRIKGKNF